MWSRFYLKSYGKTLTTFVKLYSKPAVQVSVSSEGSALTDVSKFKIGGRYHGFKVKDIQQINEFRVTALCLEHEKTKAEYLHLYRDDSNNVFAIAFRTTPMDSSGLPHILEHTVLCGSELYPVRDPFFKMLNRSLATFMNAMTGPDYTFYPFSTQNETDFHNLQKIYLDAVFRPNIRLLDFMQEGWRLENSDPNDINTPLIVKGIVFNEMKGVFAENEQILNHKALNLILPDHTYGIISGGDPFVIPRLTWENLKKFHKDHYHPSNSRFYSYGNFPLLPSLEYIDKEYLSKYEYIDISHTVVPNQTRWKEPKRAHVNCRFENMGEPLEKQNTISISLLMTDIKDTYNTFVVQFITELLIRGPNSPFYKTMVEPKISGGFTPGTGFDTQIRDTVFTLGLQGIEKRQFDEIVDIFDGTINAVLNSGFQEDHIESVLHRYELGIKHQSANFGLHLLYGLIPVWNHNGDINKLLHVNNLIKELKTNLEKNSEYLQSFVKKYFKDNPHRVILTMSPDIKYEEKYTKMEADLTKSLTKNLTQEQKRDIYLKNLELQKEQIAKDQNKEALPTLQVSDIKSDVERYPVTKSFHGPVPTHVCQVNTNGITYFRGIIGISELTPEQTMLLPLFCYIITKLGTSQLNHLEFDTLMNRKTAGLNFCIHIGESLHALHSHEPGIEVSSYCLDKNVPDMWDLWLQLFNLTELKDVKRFEMLVQLYMANLTHGLADSGHIYAMSAAAGLVSGSAYQKDLLTGLQHIIYMKRLVSTSNYKAMLMELGEIARVLFDKNKLRCAINVSEESVKAVTGSYDNFIQNFPGNALGKPNGSTYVTPKVWYPDDAIQCQHHVLNIPINFCSRSVLTVPYVDSKHAKLKVLARLLSAKYLHPELRERQGAYGGGARLSADGVFTFYSYRDPRHLATLDVFDSSSKWLHDELQTLKEQDILEAKLGVFQTVDAPLSPCQKGAAEFLRGLTPDILQRHRAEIMTTTMDDLVAVGDTYLGQKRDVLEGKVIVGPQTKDFDTSQRKYELWTVMNNDG